MMRSVLLAAAGILGTCLAAPAAAQLPALPLSVEIRAGAAVPLGDWEVAGREAVLHVGVGPLFSGGLRLALPARFSLYGAYHYGLPRCQFCDAFGLSGQLVDAGFGFGVGYALPENLPVALRLDLGGIAHQLAFRGGGARRPSDLGWGAEAALTGAFEVWPSLFVEPALAGRAYTARYQFEEDASREVEVRYLVPRIGIRYSF